MGVFLEREDSHCDHGLGSLVNLGLRPVLILHIHISPSNSSRQRNCASWASQPHKSVTLRPQPGGGTTKSIRDIWWHWIKKAKSTAAYYACDRIQLFDGYNCAWIWRQACYKRKITQMVTSGKKVMQWQRFKFLPGSTRFPLPSARVLRNSTHTMQITCDLLTKDLYLHHSHIYTTVRSESRCALIKGVASDSHERLYRTIVNKNWIKQLHILPVLHFKCTTSLDTTRPSTIFYRLLLNWASLRRHYERSLKMAM
jgi:hypothetical protein